MAIDWTKSMKQTYEFYIVNPVSGSNVKKLDNVISASVSRDITTDTQVSGSIEYDGELDEEYVRIYLVAEQGDEIEKIPLITMLCQTPSTSFNGKRKTTSITGYSPLIELQSVYPPLGYTIPSTIMNPNINLGELIPSVCEDNMRLKVLTMPQDDSMVMLTKQVLAQPYVSDPSRSWFDLIQDLLGMVSYKARVDELGRTFFEKSQNIAQMSPLYTFDTSNSSILSSDISIDRDLYGIPNIIEVVVTLLDGTTISAVAVNDDRNSAASTVARGRKVVQRVINPENLGKLANDSYGKERAQEYANELLEQASTLEYRISYKHGYCGNNIGECVRIDYPQAGISNEKAYVISQKIDCKTGCTVEETAILTKKLFVRK